nr:hypothetical protein [Tanacetum cinerariifolium]
MENVNPSSLTPRCEFLDPKKKLEVELWIGNSKNVDLLADSDSEFEEEMDEEKENMKSLYFRNKEDKKKGVEYVMIVVEETKTKEKSRKEYDSESS